MNLIYGIQLAVIAYFEFCEIARGFAAGRQLKFLALLIRLVIESSYLLRLVETGLYAINLTFFHSLVMK